jgi:phenylalanyl-tRNA synthetase beta chain
MEGMGFSEAITYSFIRESDLHDLGLTGGPDPVRVLNPISEDMSVMRTSLLPGLLQSLQLNLSRRIDDVRLYEIGRVFLPCEGCEVSEERFRIAAVMTGFRNEKNWSRERQESNFYDIKGAAENLLAALGIRDVSFQEMEMTYLQPGQSAWVVLGDRSAGPVGTVHPRITEKYDIRSWAGCFELDISVIRDAVAEKSQYRPYSRFPGVLRDMAIIVPSDSTSGEIEETILTSATDLQSVRLFDLYKGEGIPDGSRSLGFTLHFQSFERTLTDEEVDKSMKKILDTLEGKYGAKLRW